MTPQALGVVTKVIVMLKTDSSSSYFLGTDGQYAEAIMDDAGNGVDESDWGAEIPQRPLQRLIVDFVEKSDDGLYWGFSNGQKIELFFQSEGESEFETIRNGYREVMNVDGNFASDDGDFFFCRASSIGDEF